MKRTLVLILTLTLALASVAQDCHCPKFTTKEKWGENEIGINLYNITDITGIYYMYGLLSKNFINGVMYKHSHKKNALRIGLDYYYNSFNIVYPPPGVIIYDGGQTTFLGQNNIGALRIGYERMLTMTKLQPYLATDLTLTYGQIKGTTIYEGWPGNYKHANDERIKEIGISHAIGLRYHLNGKFSIALEADIGWAYYNHKDLKNPYYYSNQRSGFRTYINPLRFLSLNYHF